jgi:hypothetical protein
MASDSLLRDPLGEIINTIKTLTGIYHWQGRSCPGGKGPWGPNPSGKIHTDHTNRVNPMFL